MHGGRIFAIYNKLDDSPQDEIPVRTRLVVVALQPQTRLKVLHSATSHPHQRSRDPSHSLGSGPLPCCRMCEVPAPALTVLHSALQHWHSVFIVPHNPVPEPGRRHCGGRRLQARCPATNNTHITHSGEQQYWLPRIHILCVCIVTIFMFYIGHWWGWCHCFHLITIAGLLTNNLKTLLCHRWLGVFGTGPSAAR